ncbi:hypothetical protein [Serratia sp. UGAL515B_01]|uniref:hypothetical protein n=1 Tax=Serratia sp. UGAL515B_01 TaxID=2986763 RepID=UPI0029547317|nr:hypothetical protein [Serratia sp. UGAL515B_01]WON75550.1 hypothetical protein OK023_00095 [Serratia sp. UGAL515B_01]
MLKKNHSINEILLIAGGAFFIYLIAPALGIGAGILMSLWMNGKELLSPWAVGVNVTAVIIYVFCYLTSENKVKLKSSITLIIVGIIFLPLQAGTYDYFIAEAPTINVQNNLLNASTEQLSALAYGFIRYVSIGTGVLSILYSVGSIFEKSSS